MNTSRLASAYLIGFMAFSSVACRHSAKITSFTASPVSFTAGNSAQLCYALLNTVSARIDPKIGALNDKHQSCVTIEPRETTNYTLFATGDDGKTISTQVTVTVAPPPPLANIITFEAKRDTAAADPGSPAQLCYEVRGASSLNINPEVGKIEPVDKGCRTVKPNKTTSYELAATGTDNQTVTGQATVTVVQPPARIVRFDVSPTSIKVGDKIHICYQIEDAAGAHIANLDRAIKVGQTDCIDVQPRRSTTITLEARNSDGNSVTREARVTVEQLPVEIGDFTAQPAEIEKGRETLIHYRITNASRAQIAYPGVTLPLTALEGTVKVTPSSTATFLLTAQDPDGKTTSKSITVAVAPPAQARFLLKPADVTINRGDEATLCYGVTLGSRATINSDLSKRSRDLESSEKKCIRVRPTSTDIFTLTATGPNGAPVITQATVTVRVPPSSVSFFAQLGSQRSTRLGIVRGDKPQLCYALNNVTSATIDRYGTVEVSPRKCLDLGELATTTVYTLNAKGVDGTTKTQQVTVEVYPPPEIKSFYGRSSGGRNFLCYEYRYGVHAVISRQIGEVRSTTESGCVAVSSPLSPSYTLTVSGRGKVLPAVATYQARR